MLRFIYTDIDDVCISKKYVLVKKMGKLVSKLEINIFSVSAFLQYYCKLHNGGLVIS